MRLHSGWAFGLAAAIAACTAEAARDPSSTATPEASLEIVVVGDGRTSPPAGVHAYDAGTVVKVTATPASGASFLGWSDAASGAASPLSLKMDRDRRLVARFGDGGASSSGGGASSSSSGSSSSSSGSGSSSGSTSSSGGASSSGSSSSSGGSSSGGSSSGASSSSSSGATTASAPCDLYASGGTPCVAAHSTVRALYAAYGGNLYQVKRASDRTTRDIGALAPGGFADSAAQDTFCAGTQCTISILYDQSGRGNHLTSAPAGGAVRTPDKEANAAGLKLTVGGHPVYALWVDPGVGYRNNRTSGIATGDQAQGLYMVASGKHMNGGCCFDYGNAETTNNNDGNGTMEAIYLGNSTEWGKGSGSGPWVMADMENGLFAGANGNHSANTSVPYEYVTAIVKGKAGAYGIKAGNAQTGALKTMYEGARPTTPGYNPMRKQGAIILGIGGDNSNWSQGTFFEGAVTSGYPSDATEDAVQTSIVSAGYGR